MKKHEFNQGLDHIHPDIVEEYIAQKDKLTAKRYTRDIWRRCVAMVACVVLVACGILAYPLPPKSPPVTVAPPSHENGEFSADMIGDLFDQTYNAIQTNAYTKIAVPSPQYLYIGECFQDETIGIYRHKKSQKELDENEFITWIDGLLPDLSKALQIPTPNYEIRQQEEILLDAKTLNVYLDADPYRISMYHSSASNALSIYSTENDDHITMDGETIQINQQLSDEEIINSLQNVKKKLFDIFNVSFENVKIIRNYNDYSEHGAVSISIYFYSQDDHPLSVTQSHHISDYICLSFNNSPNYSVAQGSDDYIKGLTIRYCQYRTPSSERYVLLSTPKMISLEEAEALLYNDYVFGGHTCPLCMASQEKVSFEGYDFVDIEYVNGYEDKTTKLLVSVPFYAFYKKIGVGENGNLIYAKTYVAAIEVKGYKEYLEKQQEIHNKIP